MTIGDQILAEIIKQRMVRIGAPDPETDHVFVWSENSADQLTALVMDWAAKAGAKLKAPHA